MKKGLKLLAVSALTLVSLASCGEDSNKPKAGLIALHDDNSTYDKNFIDAFKKACEAKGYTAVIKTGVEEGNAAYDNAVDLAEQGCKFIFADSFGHESYVLKAAKEYPDIQFSHATGTTAHTSNVSNFHNAFASIYEGRYLAGVAAGMKLQEMINKDANTSTKIGYVGAWPYAEVISGYTSYFLGVQSIVPTATMEVKYTNSWYDQTGEQSTANALINDGCSIISQHADSWGAPNACEAKNVPNISYNGSTSSQCPETYIISSKVNWEPYFEYALGQVTDGKDILTDYTGNLGTDWTSGSVALDVLGKNAAEGTEAKINEVAAKLRNGTLKVFDTSKFTVTKTADKNVNATVDSEGHLTAYNADVNTDENYTPDTQVVKTAGGITYFAESEFRSAPYFDIIIDGITIA